ncbi:MAG TPA: MarR family transcriptional regulator [Propionibacteriaceae bacterium]|nr:MarR family transcriptional regulator [Propionibacteriaceae bacterium]
MQDLIETSTGPSGPSGNSDILAFQLATRDLVDLATRSVDAAAPGVSLPQMRLMFALSDSGPIPSSTLARSVGVSPSSVTRMVDRLVRAGLVDRRENTGNRSMVTLTLTDAGGELVCRVLAWRHAEWERLLSTIPPDDRQVAARVLGAIHEAVAGLPASVQRGGLPL